MTSQRNRLQRSVEALNFIPRVLRPWALGRVLGHAIPFVRTARLEIDALDQECCRIRLRPRRRVRNHIGGVHAAAAALLAETASGLVFGMNLAPDQLPLLKRMEIDYLSRAEGSLTAEATMDMQAATRIRAESRGEFTVPVSITDARNGEPMKCRMVWAWTSRREKPQPER